MEEYAVCAFIIYVTGLTFTFLHSQVERFDELAVSTVRALLWPVFVGRTLLRALRSEWKSPH